MGPLGRILDEGEGGHGPPTSASATARLSATTGVGVSAGWPHVKISRSRSSDPAPGSNAGRPSRVGWYAVAWPGPQGRRERFLHRILGDVEIAGVVGQRRGGPAALRPEHAGDRVLH